VAGLQYITDPCMYRWISTHGSWVTRGIDVQTDRACRTARNPARVWPGTNPERYVVNWAYVGLARSPGRTWAEGVARRTRPDTTRFYFFLFFHINTYIILEYIV
jgi:hypothetical protein